jgi:hypothetical protein
MFPELNFAESLVTVCKEPSWLCQMTVVPTGMVIMGGSKDAPLIFTVLVPAAFVRPGIFIPELDAWLIDGFVAGFNAGLMAGLAPSAPELMMNINNTKINAAMRKPDHLDIIEPLSRLAMRPLLLGKHRINRYTQ